MVKHKIPEKVSLEDVLDAFVKELEELQGSRIVAYASLGGLVTTLVRRGVLNASDVDQVMKIAEEIAQRMEEAAAEGLDIDALLWKGPPTDEEKALHALRTARPPNRPRRRK